MTASFSRVVGLNNGVGMPTLGLGTYRAHGEPCYRAVRWALDSGYRLVDTSLAYGNEREVGRALRDGGIPREELFITSKLENDDHGYQRTLAACGRSLANLATDYLDLYLIHWPVEGLRQETWRAMERLLEEGRCRAVGVSNYTTRHLDEVLATSEVVPAVNQVEFHPFLYQRELLAFCRGHGIVLQAYSPLVKAQRMDHPVLNAVAHRYGRTPAQVLLRWHLDHAVPAIPKSVHRGYIEENFAVWDFRLDEADRARLDALDEGRHIDWDPTAVP
jgi:diketogulonate reductase-like aldo/keto reductase